MQDNSDVLQASTAQNDFVQALGESLHRLQMTLGEHFESVSRHPRVKVKPERPEKFDGTAVLLETFIEKFEVYCLLSAL